MDRKQIDAMKAISRAAAIARKFGLTESQINEAIKPGFKIDPIIEAGIRALNGQNRGSKAKSFVSFDSKFRSGPDGRGIFAILGGRSFCSH